MTELEFILGQPGYPHTEPREEPKKKKKKKAGAMPLARDKLCSSRLPEREGEREDERLQEAFLPL